MKSSLKMNLAQYRVVKPINFGSGYVHDKNGEAIPMQDFAPKIGDIITLALEAQEKFIFNKLVIGYTFRIPDWPMQATGTTVSKYDVNVWIPADAVEKIPDVATTGKDGYWWLIIPLALYGPPSPPSPKLPGYPG